MNEKVKIIVIDDDPNIRKTLDLYLKNNGYLVDKAASGKEALEKVDEKEYDIALCDYRLPDIKGLELAKQIMEKQPSLVPVLVTGVNRMDLAMNAMRCGVHDYLVKPIDFDELGKVLKEIMEEKEKVRKSESKKAEGADEKAPEKAGEGGEVKEGPEQAVAPQENAESSTGIRVEEEVREKQETKDAVPEEDTGSALPEEEKKVPEGYIFSERRDKEKTVLDFIIDKTADLKRVFAHWGISLLLFAILFLAADAMFLQITSPGRRIHNIFWPPSLILDTVPSGAGVEIKTETGRNILKEGETSPVQVSKISPGNYQLSVEKDGFKSVSKSMSVSETSDRMHRIIVPGSSREYDGITQEFVLPLEIELEIDSRPPGAQVYINDRRLGDVTPISLDLPVDRYNIVLETEDFDPLGARTVGETVGRCLLDLSPDSDNDIDMRFWEVKQTEEGLSLVGRFWKEVSILSEPENARVYINNELAGRTPMESRIPYGDHDLMIRKEAFADWQGKVVVPGKEEINAELEKIVVFRARDAARPARSLSANLWIDGERIPGKTPVEVSVSQGRRRITFGVSDEYHTWNRNVVVRDQNTITADIERKFYPVTVHVLDEQTDEPVGGASIFVDGRRLGETSGDGRASVNIKIERQTMNIVAPGYAEKAYEYEEPVPEDLVKIFMSEDAEVMPVDDEISPEITGEKEISDEPSVLVVDARPDFPGAEIYLNGEKIGENVRRIPEIPGGEYTIEINHPYTGRVESKIYVEPGRRVIVNFNHVGEAVVQ